MPNEPTLAIRIIDTEERWRALYPPFDDSRYVHTLTYYFDDCDYDAFDNERLAEEFRNDDLEAGLVAFDESTARKIIADYQQSPPHNRLLVHCYAGHSRSPAIAIALNDIFNLGSETDALKKEHCGYSRMIYRIMMETSKR